MKYIPMLELLDDAVAGGYAVPSFCGWNAESMAAILAMATDLRAPVIVMNGPGEFPLLGPELMAPVAQAVATRFNVRAALHLDHGDSLAQVATCLDVGYTSVMLDFSKLPLAENTAALRQVVAMAHPLGVTVEGELGHVGKADTMSAEGEGDSTLTRPEEAAAYVEQTGLDALAVAIGNAHGQYTRLPQFDFSRLERIRAATRVPLVLHGGSGTPPADLQRGIGQGMAKINVATDLALVWRGELLARTNAAEKHWLPQDLGAATRQLAPVLERWFRVTGAAGRA